MALFWDLPVSAPVDRPGPVGLRSYSGRQRLLERRGLRPLTLAQLEQPAPVSQGVALRRQRPDKPLPDRTGRKPLLRAPAPVGPHLVAFRPPGPGPHSQGRPDHRHRHQRGLPQLRHSRGLAHPPRHPARLLDGPHSGTAPATGPSSPQGYDRHRALRPGHIQPQAVAADTRSGLASLYALPEEHHLLRRRRQTIACPRLRLRSRHCLGRPRHRLRPTYRPAPLHPAGGLVRRAGRTLDHPHRPAAGGRRTQLVRPALLDRTGFKAIKSLGWKWDKTRRTDPARVSRHWLVLSVATLLALAYGTRVEDAQDRRITPGNLRTPPKALSSRHRNSWQKPKRKVSVIRHGIDWLRRLLLKGRLWNRVWLLPEPWPKPKPNLEITYHAPS